MLKVRHKMKKYIVKKFVGLLACMANIMLSWDTWCKYVYLYSM